MLKMRKCTSTPHRILKRVCFSLAVSVPFLVPLCAQQKPSDLVDKSIEELMAIEVTSASKKPESLSRAPAAIFVLTGEDIRRGGFSSVPEALRMVPGLYVAQQGSHIWQVSARGFSSLFNGKMLVLIDGRAVYTPTFGGVWWDVQDPPLEDIERIEIIRGPGGTLWGANAVNGVINIIMKEAAKTQGGQVATSAGVNQGYAARARYGGNAIQKLVYRVYGTSNYWLPSVNARGIENYDASSLSQGGTRVDWDASQRDTLMFDGQGYSGRFRDSVPMFSPVVPTTTVLSEFTVKGGHLLGQWKHSFNKRSDTVVLGYCDWATRTILLSKNDTTSCDIELQHNYSLTERQSLNWGASILSTSGYLQTNFLFESARNHRTITYGGFLQYDLILVPDKFRVIVGSKFEHNGVTGFEYQPQIRAIWTPTGSHTMWFAVSRAVRTPTLGENNTNYRLAELSTAPATFLLVVGDPTARSEVLHAYEMGYRYEWNHKVLLDTALFYNAYDKLLGLSAPGPPIIHLVPFYVDVPVTDINAGGGQTHGGELYLRYAPIRGWTVSAAITELRGNSVPPLLVPAAANNPRHFASVQSKLDLTRHINFDVNYYYYDAVARMLPTRNRIDVGISTKPIRGFTLSVWGRNLQSDRHQETEPLLFPAGEIRRSAVLKLVWESQPDPKQGKPRGDTD